jgi:hypothetical protein
VIQPQNFRDLLALRREELARCDIALVNLLCAVGLPGAEELDIGACLARVGAWAEEVRRLTEWNFRRFTPRTPRDTPGFVRCWTLYKLLRHGKGLEHHLRPPDDRPDVRSVAVGCSIPGPDSCYRRAEPVFIHGLLGAKKIGSCASFPVLFAAIGRRLGYPLKVALSAGHAFNRWDDPADTFNMDAGSFHINRHPDEYYIDWPKPWTAEEKECGAFLRPLTPTEELGFCLGLRAGVLRANFQLDEALEMCDLAHHFFPQDPLYPQLGRMVQYAIAQRFMESDGWGHEPDEEHNDDSTDSAPQDQRPARPAAGVETAI